MAQFGQDPSRPMTASAVYCLPNGRSRPHPNVEIKTRRTVNSVRANPENSK
jgi:hypothetical protein